MVRKKLIFDYTIPGLYNAGIRNWSNDFLRSLGKTGLYEILIITPIEIKELKNFGDVKIIPYQRYRIPILHRFIYYRLRFQPYVTKSEFNIIVSPYFQLPLSVLKHKDCIIVIHDTLYFDLSKYYNRIDFYLLKLITNYFHNLNVKYSKKILTVSQFTAERLFQLFNLKPSGIFYNVPDNNYVECDGPIQITESIFFVYFGGWERRKRADLAMKLASQIMEIDKDIRFVVSGVNSKTDIAKYFKGDKLDRVVFSERFSKEEMNLYWSRCKFSIYTSAFEGFGIPLLESQLYGKPVIVFEDLIISNEIPLLGIIRINAITNLEMRNCLLQVCALSADSIKTKAEEARHKLNISNFNFSLQFYDQI